MKADEATHERIEHVQRAILHVLAYAVVALLLESPNDMDREEPQTQVDPPHNHKSVEDGTDESWKDVDRQLE